MFNIFRICFEQPHMAMFPSLCPILLYLPSIIPMPELSINVTFVKSSISFCDLWLSMALSIRSLTLSAP